MNNKIKKAETKALSSYDVLKICNNKARVLTYPELDKFNDLDQAMGKHKALILLYTTSENFGHWTCIFKVNDKLIEFFDSYGYSPDDEFSFISPNVRIEQGEVFPHLCYLIFKSNYDLIYNTKKLQKDKKDINTCGRHVGYRLRNRKMPLDKYISMLVDSGNPDKFVTEETMKIIGK